VVDEAAFRHARGAINRLPCVFGRALLARHAACELAVRHQIAGREAVACAQPVARAICAQMSTLLRDKSAFTMGLTGPGTRRILPPATVMKIQCGGLDGLKALLDAGAVAPDVRRLVRLAQERYGDLAELPFSEIVQGVAAWKPRPRRSGDPP
jgi:hypothetical protein